MSHRFRRFAQILDLFGLWIKSTQISQMTQIFLLEICVSLSHRLHRFTQIFCLDIWGIFLSIMARKNLCKSVESVGLLKRLTFSPFLIRFSLLYFFLRDALAVDGTPGEDDVGEHERDEEGGYRHGAERELAAATVGEGERTLKVDVRRIVGGIVPAGYQQQNQHGEHGSDARKPDSLSILHAPR